MRVLCGGRTAVRPSAFSTPRCLRWSATFSSIPFSQRPLLFSLLFIGLALRDKREKRGEEERSLARCKCGFRSGRGGFIKTKTSRICSRKMYVCCSRLFPSFPFFTYLYFLQAGSQPREKKKVPRSLLSPHSSHFLALTTYLERVKNRPWRR